MEISANEVETFYSKNKRVVWGVVIALLLFVGGYGTGRMTQPAKVVEKEKVVTQVQEKVVYQDRVVTQKVYVQVEKKHEHTETTTTKKPDGEVVTTTKTDTSTDDQTNDDENKTDTQQETKEKVVYQTVEKLKLVEAKSMDWRVGVGAGISIPYFLGQPELGVPGLRGVVIQAEIDRRILGPFFLGVSGNTQGVVALNLSGVF